MKSTHARDVIARAASEGTPLIDGDRATFVWRGDRPPKLIGDFTHWEREPLALRNGRDGVWTRTIQFYDDAYVEYVFLDGDRRMRDPHNHRHIPNGMGATNHYFYMPKGRSTDLIRRAAGVAPGHIERHVVSAPGLVTGGRRAVDLYAPAARGPWPLLVVFDGDDYRRFARLPAIVDNLIARRRVRPFAMALVHNSRERVLEYAASEVTLTFVAERVLPLARERLELTADATHAVLGASMGGLMAMYAGLQAPDIFGAVIAQSGAFWLPQWRENAVFQLARARPRKLRLVWLDIGHLEYLVPGNRRLLAILRRRRYDVRYREYHAGHNWTAWRNDVWRGLEAAFAPRGATTRRRSRA